MKLEDILASVETQYTRMETTYLTMTAVTDKGVISISAVPDDAKNQVIWKLDHGKESLSYSGGTKKYASS